MKKNFKILVVEDDTDLRKSLEKIISKLGYSVKGAANGKIALQLQEENEFDLIFTDIIMPGMDGIDLLKEIKEGDYNTNIVIITGHSSIKGAVDAIKLGADDYLTKPFEIEEIENIAQKIYKFRALEENVNILKQEISRKNYSQIIGNSSPMRKMLEQINSVALSDINVLITGESGTGKELVAQAIHQASKRKKEPFVPVNCAAIPHELFESELFGHEKGAFSGAHGKKYGLFETANKGILFLDEIGEMPLDMQSKLLRVVESQSMRRVGGTEQLNIDVRIICATNRELVKAIDTKEFRQDLYFRLNKYEIKTPTLRARRQDIPLLVNHYIQRKSYPENLLDENIYAALMMYHWPGNVRELENVIDVVFVNSHYKKIKLEHLPSEIRKVYMNKVKSDRMRLEEIKTLEEHEKKYILECLAYFEGNKMKTAKALKIGLRTLYRKLEKYEIVC